MSNSKKFCHNLGSLLSGFPIKINKSMKDCNISGLSLDSRKIKKGDLFFAIQGKKYKGSDFITEANRRGAIAILSDNKEKIDNKVTFVPNLRYLIGSISSKFYNEPSKKLNTFVVTGTNGKTTCVETLFQIGNLLGERSAYLSTIGSSINKKVVLNKSPLTTPNPIDLQKALFEMRSDKIKLVSIEASSHGLKQSRLNGLEVDVAILTSFSQDHLDYHKNMKEYSRSKMILFNEFNPKIAVLNINSLPGTQLEKDLKVWQGFTSTKVIKILEIDRFNIKKIIPDKIDVIYSFSRETEDLLKVELKANIFNLKETFFLKTMSKALASNVVSSIVALLAFGYDLSKVYPLLDKVKFPPGRMERVNLNKKDICFIDYAHTPDALSNALKEIRDSFPKRNIWCLFGCGGERDKSKRPLMGSIANQLADKVVITNDNPREEKATDIINQIISGKDQSLFKVIPQRLKAIRYCIETIQKSDQTNVLLIAGKGHENYQEIMGEKKLFSDLDAVNTCIRAL